MRAIVPLNKMVSAWSEKITLVAVSGLAKMAKMANHWARGLIVKAQKLDVVAGIQIRDAGISLIGGSLGGWRVKNEHIRAPPAIDRIAPMPACRTSLPASPLSVSLPAPSAKRLDCALLSSSMSLLLPLTKAAMFQRKINGMGVIRAELDSPRPQH
jgi:hypothetical protein